MIISNPHQIDVTYSLGVTPVEPMIPRKYTVFPGQHTSVPSIQIGIEFAYDHMQKERNEYLASFVFDKGFYSLTVYYYIGAHTSTDETITRYLHFLEQLPVILSSIYHTDASFFEKYPLLMHCPIFIIADSPDLPFLTKKSIGSLYQYK